MIQWSSSNLLVENREGENITFDIDRLREELKEAFRHQGIAEDWMVEHLALTIEEKIRSGNENHERLTEADIHKILGNILIAAGYGEVASEYLKLHQQLEFFKPGELQEWSPESMTECLGHHLPLSEKQLEQLSRECFNALKILGFSAVTSAFLRELAVHLLHFRRLPKKQPQVPEAGEPVSQAEAKPADIGPRYPQMEFITAESWIDFADAPGRALIDRKIIRPLPLSDLFPKARIEFRMFQCQQVLGGWNSELAILSRLPDILSDTLKVLNCMRDYISSTWPRFGNPPGHIIFSGFNEFFSPMHFLGSRRSREKFQHEVEKIIDEILIRGAGYSLQVSYRK